MKKRLVAAIALAFGIGLGSAHAATIGSISSAYPNFLWEDDNIEGLFTDDNGNGLLDVGDSLRGIIEISAIYSTDGGTTQVADTEGLGITDNHLAAVFETEVKTKTTLLDADGNFAGYSYTFGPAGGDTGTIATFYESAVDNLNLFNCGATFAICEGFVTDGTKILELGFAGDADEFWTVGTVPTDDPDLGLFESQTTSFNFGDFNAGLSVLFSSIGTFAETQSTLGIGPGGDNDLVQWTLGGTVKGTCTEPTGADLDLTCDAHIGSYGAGYTATSDSDLTASLVQQVPEPGSLALVGLALLGLGGTRLRRRS